MGENVKTMLTLLANGEDALSLADFIEKTHLPVDRLAEGLDLLVALRILQCDTSYHHSEIGEVMYMFADNANAQAVYQSIVEA